VLRAELSITASNLKDIEVMPLLRNQTFQVTSLTLHFLELRAGTRRQDSELLYPSLPESQTF